MLSKLIILSDIQLMMKITLKMSRSTSAEPFLILLKGTKNLSLNRGDKKCHKKSYEECRLRNHQIYILSD